MGNIATLSVCFQWSVWLKLAMPSGGELRQLRHKHVQTLRTAFKKLQGKLLLPNHFLSLHKTCADVKKKRGPASTHG